tara:strand:- start:170 stop:634 length:465 start_codon:yes stop_codon:yes gene_type:complete
MANYATNADLQSFIPSILENGVTDFTAQLTLASSDVLELVKLDWYVDAATTRYSPARETIDYAPFLSNFDEQYLNTAALKQLTCYRALHKYICPMLTNDVDEADEWNRKEERYKSYYDEEWAKIKRMALYDFDQDSSFEDIERRETGGFRVARA